MAARKTAPRAGSKPSRKRSGLGTLILTGLLALGIGGSVFGGIVGWFYYTSVCGTPCIDIEPLRTFRPDEGSILYDRSGQEIGMLYQQNRKVVSLQEMPPHLIHAFVDTEDKRFYRHQGVDYWRIGGALAKNLVSRRIAEGFSTITMQLARNAFPEAMPYTQKTLRRKFMEVRVAGEIEAALSKDEILERYLNTIYLGSGAYGVEAAAKTYFGKSVSQVSTSEAAILAALPKAPSKYSPYRSLEAAKKRRDIVLGLMYRAGDLGQRDYEAALAEPIRLAHASMEEANAATRMTAPYFIEEVRKDLEAQFGQALYRGGLRIHTTLDAKLQEVAEREVALQMSKVETGEFGTYKHPTHETFAQENADDPQPQVETPYVQAAVLVLDAQNGDVLVMVGGRDFEHSRFNRTMQAVRQPGSTFKPFVYGAAIENGYGPSDPLSDRHVEVVLPEGGTWEPRNFSEEEGEETEITLRQALKQSRNRATVRLSQAIGVEQVVNFAHRMGIQSTIPELPSVVLGSIDLRMNELVSAYSPLAREDGQRVEPRLVVRVEDSRGNVLLQRPAHVEPAVSPAVAYVLRDMLRDVVDHGTGYNIRRLGYKGPAAGKTGTTNEAHDLWFVGVTPRLVAGVWVGLDRPKPIVRGRLGTGGAVAAPIWGEIMKAATLPGDSALSWTRPEGVSESLRVQIDCGEFVSPDTLQAPGTQINGDSTARPTDPNDAPQPLACRPRPSLEEESETSVLGRLKDALLGRPVAPDTLPNP